MLRMPESRTFFFSRPRYKKDLYGPIPFDLKAQDSRPGPTVPWLFAAVMVLLAFGQGGIARISESHDVRFERLGPFGGEVRSILIAPDEPRIVFLGTSDGQIFKSTDGGKRWEQLFPGLNRRHFAVDTLVAHPTERGHIYAGGWDLRSDGGGLFESLDFGHSWRLMALPQTSSAVRDLAISAANPQKMIAGTLDAGLVSDDGGVSWRKVNSVPGGFNKIESVAIDPKEPEKIYLGTWRLSYRSTDFGRSWTKSENGMLLDSDVFSIAVNPENPSIIYASACSGVYRSTNRGQSWIRLRLLSERFTVRSQVVYLDPKSPSRVYVGSTEGLFVSENDGQSWRRITNSEITVNSIQVDPKNRRRLLIGTESQGVMRSEDGGATWKESNDGFIHRQVSRILLDPLKPNRFVTGILSEGARGGYYLFDGEGGGWTSMTAGLHNDTDILSFLTLPGGKGRLAGTGRGVYLQSTSGALWVKLPGPIAKLRVSDLVFDHANSLIFAATEEGVYRSRLSPLSFQSPVTCRLRPQVQSIVLHARGESFVYAVSNMGVIRSRNQGATWEVASSGLPSRCRVQCLAMDPSDRGHLLVGTTIGLFESSDAGESWLPVPDPIPGIDVVSVIFLQPGGLAILAADNNAGGVHLSQDGGKSWIKLYSSRFGSPVRYLTQDPTLHSRIYLGTGSEGVYTLTLPNSIPASASN